MKARFLLEIFTEEIPYSLQINAQKDFSEVINNVLKENDIIVDSIDIFSTPLRLVCDIKGLPHKVKDKQIEKKGPSTDASKDVIDVFLSKNFITLDKCVIKNNGKGNFYFYYEVIKGCDIKDFLENITTNIILSSIKFKKSMKWGKDSFNWGRPIRNLCGILQLNNEILFLNLNYKGIPSSNIIIANKFLNIKTNVHSIDNYYSFLAENKVILNAEERKNLILNYINNYATQNNLQPHITNNLLLELSYLVESPNFLQGDIPQKYLILPSELLISTMVKNQRYLMFVKDNKVHNKFVIVSNFMSQNNGTEVIKGNEKVLKARLEDALFFYNNDLKQTLQSKVEDLKSINYFEGLGTLWDKKERVKNLFKNIFNENQDALCDVYKADLTTQVVAEFTDLQGIMGYYYAIHNGLNQDISIAIKESYKPQGPNDALPSSFLGAKLALLDKLDSIISFFSINKKPSGSKDPFALRRCAIGIIRIILEYKISINLSVFCNKDVCDFILERFNFYIESLNTYPQELVKSFINKADNVDIIKIFVSLQNNNQLLQHKNIDFFIKLYKRVDNILEKDLELISNNTPTYDYEMDKSEKELFQILTNFTLKNQQDTLSQLEIFIDSTNNFLNNVSIANSPTLQIKTARLAILKNILNHLEVFKEIAFTDA